MSPLVLPLDTWHISPIQEIRGPVHLACHGQGEGLGTLSPTAYGCIWRVVKTNPRLCKIFRFLMSVHPSLVNITLHICKQPSSNNPSASHALPSGVDTLADALEGRFVVFLGALPQGFTLAQVDACTASGLHALRQGPGCVN